jgi:pilus assembly protein CpaE
VTRFLVSTTGDEFARRVRLAVTDQVDVRPALSAANAARFMMELSAGEIPEVVVFGPGVATDVALDVAGYLDQKHPGTVVVLATGVGPDEWLLAMRAGIREVAAPDAELADLRNLLQRAAATAATRRATLTPQVAEPRGRVIPVISPKGGTGKTTVATNLAVGLAKMAPQRTVIVDLDLQFGDVASALRLAPEQDLSAVLRAGDIDAMALKTFLTPHRTGVFALCAPDSPAVADSISGEDVSKLIGLLATQFRYVVVDTAPGLVETTLAVLDEATDVVMVCGMDVPSIRGVHKELAILDELGFDQFSRHLLLNFADRNSGLTVADVETVVGAGVDLVLPRSKAVPLSTNRGVPLLESGVRDNATKALQSLVGRFQVQLAKTGKHGPKHRALSR